MMPSMPYAFIFPKQRMLCLIAAFYTWVCLSASAMAQDETLPLPYSPSHVREWVTVDYGRRSVRVPRDSCISMPHLVANKHRCFIVISKKDYYLYVYEALPQGDTQLVARYDVAVGRLQGQKKQERDMRTPHGRFLITSIEAAGEWSHDFDDGRGLIPSYGAYFLRLRVPQFHGFGIHGSTNNDPSVPGRASEGCVRLRDHDLVDLVAYYAYPGMPVLIKEEHADDLPFETRAMRNQNVTRLRHFNPSHTLTNEVVSLSWAIPGMEATTLPYAPLRTPGNEALVWPSRDNFDSIMNYFLPRK